MVRGKLEVGRWGEDLAVMVLESRGYRLLHRNWRPESGSGQPVVRGEIDAVMVDPDENLVFVEVKTRSSGIAGHPLESITDTKSQKLKSLAYSWCRHNPSGFRSIRIDAVAVCGQPENFIFEHLKAVV